MVEYLPSSDTLELIYATVEAVASAPTSHVAKIFIEKLTTQIAEDEKANRVCIDLVLCHLRITSIVVPELLTEIKHLLDHRKEESWLKRTAENRNGVFQEVFGHCRQLRTLGAFTYDIAGHLSQFSAEQVVPREG